MQAWYDLFSDLEKESGYICPLFSFHFYYSIYEIIKSSELVLFTLTVYVVNFVMVLFLLCLFQFFFCVLFIVNFVFIDRVLCFHWPGTVFSLIGYCLGFIVCICFCVSLILFPSVVLYVGLLCVILYCYFVWLTLKVK